MFTIFLTSFCASKAIQKGHISIYETNFSTISKFSVLLSLSIKINPITNSDLGGGGLHSASTTVQHKAKTEGSKVRRKSYSGSSLFLLLCHAFSIPENRLKEKKKSKFWYKRVCL